MSNGNYCQGTTRWGNWDWEGLWEHYSETQYVDICAWVRSLRVSCQLKNSLNFKISNRNRMLWFLPKTTTWSQLLFITYTIKNEKGKPRKKDSPLLKNDITRILWTWYVHLYSRYQQSPIIFLTMKYVEKLSLGRTKQLINSNTLVP